MKRVSKKEFPHFKGTDIEEIYAGVDPETGNFLIQVIDSGPICEEAFGRDEYEYGISLEPCALAALWPYLVSAIVNEKCALTVNEITAACEQAGVDPNWWSWP